MFARQDSMSSQGSPRATGQGRKQASTVDLNGLRRPTDRKLIAVGMRKWFRFDKNGEASVIQADKFAITHQLGIQLRDLRLLDPQLATSYPSAILCREKALVVNLEYIKCIITTDHVLVLNSEDENVMAFIEELQKRLALSGDELHPFTDSAAAMQDKCDPELHEAIATPWELRALEVALDMVCSYLERLTADLESAAHPALDALTAKVSSHNLERVRRIKNRMVRLNTKVETVRELLEKLLGDDSDMKDMNLTAKAEDMAARHLELERRSSLISEHSVVTPEMAAAAGAGGIPVSGIATAQDLDDDDDDDVEAVEMVLEAYFMHIDNTWNKLQTLCEYIDDTEDYINIELDNLRNQLIRLELMLTAGTFAAALIGVVSGLFGMNLNNQHQASYVTFVLVSVLTSVGAVLVLIGIILYARYKKLIG